MNESKDGSKGGSKGDRTEGRKDGRKQGRKDGHADMCVYVTSPTKIFFYRIRYYHYYVYIISIAVDTVGTGIDIGSIGIDDVGITVASWVLLVLLVGLVRRKKKEIYKRGQYNDVKGRRGNEMQEDGQKKMEGNKEAPQGHGAFPSLVPRRIRKKCMKERNGRKVGN
jgi:hypothetical protein